MQNSIRQEKFLPSVPILKLWGFVNILIATIRQFIRIILSHHQAFCSRYSGDLVVYMCSFYQWNTGLVTGLGTLPPRRPPYLHPLKTFWKFFAKLVLPRKQSLNFPVVFPLKFYSNLAPKVLCTHPPSVLCVCLLGPSLYSPPKIMNQFHRSWNRL